MLVRPTPLVEAVIGSAIEVHRAIGPGLLESAYAACLAHELTLRGVPFRQQVAVPIVFIDVRLDCGYRADFVINFNVTRLVDGVRRLLVDAL